jgi:hypothetical protein
MPTVAEKIYIAARPMRDLRATYLPPPRKQICTVYSSNGTTTRSSLILPSLSRFPRRRLPGRTRRIVVSSRTCEGIVGQVQDQRPALVVAATAGIRFQPGRQSLYASVTIFWLFV